MPCHGTQPTECDRDWEEVFVIIRHMSNRLSHTLSHATPQWLWEIFKVLALSLLIDKLLGRQGGTGGYGVAV